MRVVLDTNVLISAMFFSGLPARILSAWLADRFELVVSTEILEEYREVAGRIGARFPGVELSSVLDRIALHALLVVPVHLPVDACTDRDDSLHGACRHAGKHPREDSAMQGVDPAPHELRQPSWQPFAPSSRPRERV
jgi:putative PIN family toxin of toxin-antitoxin system